MIIISVVDALFRITPSSSSPQGHRHDDHGPSWTGELIDTKYEIRNTKCELVAYAKDFAKFQHKIRMSSSRTSDCSILQIFASFRIGLTDCGFAYLSYSFVVACIDPPLHRFLCEVLRRRLDSSRHLITTIHTTAAACRAMQFDKWTTFNAIMAGVLVIELGLAVYCLLSPGIPLFVVC
jgi:hypothetical protein